MGNLPGMLNLNGQCKKFCPCGYSCEISLGFLPCWPSSLRIRAYATTFGLAGADA